MFLRGWGSLLERREAGEQELLIPQELREPPEPSRGLDRTSPRLWVSEHWCGKQMGGGRTERVGTLPRPPRPLTEFLHFRSQKGVNGRGGGAGVSEGSQKWSCFLRTPSGDCIDTRTTATQCLLHSFMVFVLFRWVFVCFL